MTNANPPVFSHLHTLREDHAVQTYFSKTLKAHVTVPAATVSVDLPALAACYLALLNVETIPLTAPLSVASVLSDLFGLAEIPVLAMIRHVIEGGVRCHTMTRTGQVRRSSRRILAARMPRLNIACGTG